ncbi:MAG: hypothetical protein GXX84_15595 [Acidobacteria bacterium]|nr:hypothetical protein [Acidobacteriota bacterium]
MNFITSGAGYQLDLAGTPPHLGIDGRYHQFELPHGFRIEENRGTRTRSPTDVIGSDTIELQVYVGGAYSAESRPVGPERGAIRHVDSTHHLHQIKYIAADHGKFSQFLFRQHHPDR